MAKISKIAPTDRISLVGKPANPMRKETAVYKRVAAVLQSPSVAAARKKGARLSTVRWAVNNKLITLKPVKS